MCSCCAVHHQVHCLVENGAVLDRADNGSSRGSDRTSGCQNPALVASLLKKASKTGTTPEQPLTANMLIFVLEIVLNWYRYRYRSVTPVLRDSWQLY